MPAAAILLYIPLSLVLGAIGYLFVILLMISPFVRLGCYIYENIKERRKYNKRSFRY
jgi:hypothetical protein